MRWFTEKLTLQNKTGNDEYDKPILGENKNIKGKTEKNNKLIIDQQGKEIISQVIIFTGTKENIEVGDYINKYEVIQIKPVKNFKGVVKYLEVLAK